MARPRSFPRSRSKGRLTQWVGPAIQNYLAVASGGATLIFSFTPAEAITIVRTRGFVSVKPEAVTADLDFTGAFGIGIVSEEAFNAGVGSMPEPFTDADWSGWFVWRSFAFDFEFEDATGINYPNWNFELDSKAMRRIGPNEVLVAIAESQSGAYRINAPTRTLIKLS